MVAINRSAEAPIRELRISTFVIPTDQPESDGTLEWDKTTMVLVELEAGGQTGLGYTYADRSAATLIAGLLRDRVVGRDVMDVPAIAANLMGAVRNQGQRGIAAMAVSAIDAALWDTKARVLGLPLVKLLGAARDQATVYGSGGFTSYTVEKLCAQLTGWAADGIGAVKMKVGRDVAADLQRARAVREALGAGPELFVDANGAYERKQALEMAEHFARLGVTWFEEPVSSDDLAGLRLLRDRVPPPIRIAAGEYGFRPTTFRRLLNAGAVDVLQADATRCGGPTGFLQAGGIADTAQIPLSAHCAPSLHRHLCLAVPRYLNLEYFHDHCRIEHLLFDGAATAVDGALRADLARPGMGLELKRKDAERFAV
ncbi:MAG: enolase C-terminal domain-like protein [Verrucomicrobiota bacterium]